MIENLTLDKAKDLLATKQVTSVELTDSYLKAIDQHKNLNAYVTVTPDIALEQATASDARRTKGEATGLVDGIPLAIKDLFCTKGVRTTACSRILHNFIPPYESTVSQNLLDQGGVMLGKTNMDEFAMGSANTTSYFGPVLNPWKAKDSDEDLVPGGSSGGSSAAVAARLCLGATGSDTGGSIRQPASFTGIVGLKPTYGRCSRWGMVAFASSLDQAGPMAHNVESTRILFEAMASYDPKDSTSVDHPLHDAHSQLSGDLKGLRVGIPKEYRLEGMCSQIDDIWKKSADILRKRGAEIVDVSLPNSEHALPTYYILAPAEASSNLARYDGVRYGLREEAKDLQDLYLNTRSKGFGKEVQRRILIGTYVLSAGSYDAYYVKAQRVRRLIANDFENAFRSVDVILTPSTPNTAFPVNAKNMDPLEMYLNDVFTVPMNLAGIPALSLPVGLAANGLPLGMQLIANNFQEPLLFRVAKAIEDDVQFTDLPRLLTDKGVAA